MWAVVYKLKCLNICISFCLRLACSHTHIAISYSRGRGGKEAHCKVFVVTTLVFGGGCCRQEREKEKERKKEGRLMSVRLGLALELWAGNLV